MGCRLSLCYKVAHLNQIVNRPASVISIILEASAHRQTQVPEPQEAGRGDLHREPDVSLPRTFVISPWIRGSPCHRRAGKRNALADGYLIDRVAGFVSPFSPVGYIILAAFACPQAPFADRPLSVVAVISRTHRKKVSAADINDLHPFADTSRTLRGHF
jgi:hypothetical protein